MKKVLLTLIALTAAAYAQETVKVTGDRVSLRAAPEANAVLLSKANLDDELVLRDNGNPDWVGVLPPEKIDLWVSGEFVSNNVVLPEILNIRSGPSLSHSVVGTAVKGDALTVRGEAGGWVKVAPSSNTTVWISRSYVDAPAMVQVIIDAPEIPSAFQEIAEVVQNAVKPSVQETATAAPVPAEKKLTLNPAKEQGAEAAYSGVLQPEDEQLYKLVDDHFSDVLVCYVRGNAAQMKTFSGMKLEIAGKTYWVAGKDLPVIVPVRIKPYATGGK